MLFSSDPQGFPHTNDSSSSSCEPQVSISLRLWPKLGSAFIVKFQQVFHWFMNKVKLFRWWLWGEESEDYIFFLRFYKDCKIQTNHSNINIIVCLLFSFLDCYISGTKLSRLQIDTPSGTILPLIFSLKKNQCSRTLRWLPKRSTRNPHMHLHSLSQKLLDPNSLFKV